MVCIGLMLNKTIDLKQIDNIMIELDGVLMPANLFLRKIQDTIGVVTKDLERAIGAAQFAGHKIIVYKTSI